MRNKLFVIFLFMGPAMAMLAQGPAPKEFNHALEMFPVGEINIVQYGKMVTPFEEVVVGLIWYDPQIMGVLKYPGTQRVLAGEAGYRWYLWQGLHLELQALPQVHFLQETGKSQGTLAGVVASEIRLGYRWELTLGELTFFVNPQFFAGLYWADGRPEAFISADRSRGLHPLYVSPVPMIFLGMRF